MNQCCSEIYKTIWTHIKNQYVDTGGHLLHLFLLPPSSSSSSDRRCWWNQSSIDAAFEVEMERWKEFWPLLPPSPPHSLCISLIFTLLFPHHTYNFPLRQDIIILFPPKIIVRGPAPHQTEVEDDSDAFKILNPLIGFVSVSASGCGLKTWTEDGETGSLDL